MEKPEMVELSVQISELVNYNINIPKVISSDNFSEILKRLKIVHTMLPMEAIILKFKEGVNPLLQLTLEEGEDIYRLYQSTTPESFDEFLKEKYIFIAKDRPNLISLMGRIKKRNENLKARRKKDV